MFKKRIINELKKIIGLIMIALVIVSWFVDSTNVSAASKYNAEQQKILTALNAVGYNFAFDDNYENKNISSTMGQSNKTYYFSSSKGDEKNDGLSADKPKKYPDYYFKKNNINIRLLGGDTFVLKYASQVGSNVTISTYGNDKRAIVDYAYQNSIALWEYHKANKYYSARVDTSLATDIGCLIIDGELYWKKKLKLELFNDGEYYYDRAAKRIYVRSSTSLNGKKFKVTLPNSAFVFLNSNNSCIENIEIKNAGIHGIDIHDSANIRVNNCYVHGVGGAIHPTNKVKYGNGIQVWATGCQNIYITNNTLASCFDAGITAQIGECSTTSNNIVFANNIIRKCNYGFEFFQYYSNPVKNVVVTNNVFYDIMDITNGYRLTKSKTDYTAAFCLWRSESSETSVTIKNNIAYCGKYYGISYSYDKTPENVYKFSNNKILVESEDKKVKYPKNYSGNASQFKVTSEVPNFNLYKNIIENVVAE